VIRLVLIFACGLVLGLWAENYRQGRLVMEVSAALSASQMELTRANIKLAQMADTVHQLRTGRID
jgi:hypothetical protein